MGLHRRTARLVIGGMAGLAMAGSLPPSATAVQPTPRDNPGRGMVWAGLAPGRSEHRCWGGFEMRGRDDQVLGCTHGPDPAPAGIDPRVARAVAPLAATAAALPVPAAGPGTNAEGIACAGDGTSGHRIEAIYAVAGPTGTRPDRYEQVRSLIRSSYAPFLEWQARTSAAETGGEVHLPFVTVADAAGCTLVVRHEVLTSAGDDSFSNTVDELKARGYNRGDRRYMVWMDASVLCGIGQLYLDSQPGPANANSGPHPAFTRVDTACWGYGEGHELMHSLGGIQPGAPHATPNFHCWDQNDVMCYDDDGSGPVVMQPVCPDRDPRLFDCGHDDYFRAGPPPAGSWLATHWNTYDSPFLLRGALAAPADPAPAVDAARPVVDGATFFIDGTSARSADADTTVSAFASFASDGFVYSLVLARDGCANTVAVLNHAPRYANASGFIGATRGRVPAGTPAGAYEVCFKDGAGVAVTGPATLTVPDR